MATTPTPKQTVRPPLPPPGPSNIFIMTPYPFAPSRRELKEHEELRRRLEEQRDACGGREAEALDK